MCAVVFCGNIWLKHPNMKSSCTEFTNKTNTGRVWRQTEKHSSFILIKAAWDLSLRGLVLLPHLNLNLNLKTVCCLHQVSSMSLLGIVMVEYRPLQSQTKVILLYCDSHIFLDYLQTCIAHERWSTDDLSPLQHKKSRTKLFYSAFHSGQTHQKHTSYLFHLDGDFIDKSVSFVSLNSDLMLSCS